MATVNNLIVSSNEQWLELSNGYSAYVRFDLIYKRWYYDVYNENGLLYGGIPLDKDCAPLKGISPVYLMIIEDNKDGIEYEPYSELGGILVLTEVTE